MFGIRRRRTLIRLLSFTIAGFGVAIGMAAWGWWLAYSYRMSIEYTYQRALNELSVHVNNIDLALQKGIYAGTPAQLVGLSAQIWRDSGAAKTDLSQIPLQNEKLDNTYKFLSQVGDFANTMSQNTAFDQKISKGDRNKMTLLSGYAKKLSVQLGDMVDDLQQGRLTIFTAKNAMKGKTDSNAGSQPTVDNGFKEIENNFSSMPTLIYDGPFSDNVAKKTSVFTNVRSSDLSDALKSAAGFLKTGASSLKSQGQTSGNLPTWNFVTDTVNISVTKAGGYVARMIDSRKIGGARLKTEDALKKARDFLQKNGIASMTESYYQISNDICVVNYAYMQGDVICYPDLIKIGIALDNGSVVSFDATGYLMNHTERKLASPKASVAKLKENISPALTAERNSLAVIPTENGGEALCYEFKCKSKNGQTVLDYYDVSTGRERQILILLQTAGGTLAI